jgi:hypothetical protein
MDENPVFRVEFHRRVSTMRSGPIPFISMSLTESRWLILMTATAFLQNFPIAHKVFPLACLLAPEC